MFFTLLIITFLIALAVSFGVVRLFDRPIASILRRIVEEEVERGMAPLHQVRGVRCRHLGRCSDPRAGTVYLGTPEG